MIDQKRNSTKRTSQQDVFVIRHHSNSRDDHMHEDQFFFFPNLFSSLLKITTKNAILS